MEGKQESWYLGWNSLYPDRCRDGDELYDLWIQHHILANIPMVRLSQVAAAAEWIVWGLSFHPHMLCSRSVTQSCLTLWDPMDCSPPGPSVHGSQAKRLQWDIISYSRGSSPPRDRTHISCIFCHSLLLLPSIFSCIRAFSNELALRIRWSKYWSFGFGISPSNEYSW